LELDRQWSLVMSTAHDVWTKAAFHSRVVASKPSNLLLPGATFAYFAVTAIIAGAVLALVT
jgi:hypothetical protein